MNYPGTIGIILAVILAAVGAFFAYKCFMLWRQVSTSGIAVEVTKNRSFLSINFKLTLVIGALAGLHLFFEIWEMYGLPTAPFIWAFYNFFYYLNLTAIMLVLLIMAITWYKLLSKVDRWDRRLIKPNK